MALTFSELDARQLMCCGVAIELADALIQRAAAGLRSTKPLQLEHDLVRSAAALMSAVAESAVNAISQGHVGQVILEEIVTTQEAADDSATQPQQRATDAQEAHKSVGQAILDQMITTQEPTDGPDTQPERRHTSPGDAQTDPEGSASQ
ncbi:MAG: hypothetical protein IIA68_09505 [Proteobacteria bacterium]|nr:hypothetical protein [Pseudomonadota bacterium]